MYMTGENSTEIEPEDVEPALRPLMFGPTGEWFEDSIEQYYMATGGMGRVGDISPYAITLYWVNNGESPQYYPERANEFESLASDDMTVVNNEQEARDHGSPATWKEESGGQLFVWERIPFDDVPVTTREQFEAELNDILMDGVNIESKLDEAENVVSEMNEPM